jgi:hypothetical protein
MRPIERGKGGKKRGAADSSVLGLGVLPGKHADAAACESFLDPQANETIRPSSPIHSRWPSVSA